jgi:hypothetical protein
MESSLASRPFVTSRTDYTAVALPALIWVFAVIVVNPIGNFPLEDDWSYSLTVRHLLETGVFQPLGWTSMSLIGQTIWGALFCLPFGFSFEALRVSTLVAGVLGLAGTAMFLQQSGCDRRKTILATLVLGFNPIYLALAVTFMTDVSFATLCVFSTLFFCRYLNKREITSLLLAILCATWAVSIRQLALFLPLAMLVTLFAENRRDWRAIVAAAAGLIASAALLKALSAWLNAIHAVPPVYIDVGPLVSRLLSPSTASFAAIEARFAQDAWYLRAAIVQLGLSLFPVLLLRLPALVRDYRSLRWGKWWLTGAALCGTAWFGLQVLQHHILPYNTWTTIHASGLGPIWLSDARFAPDVPALPVTFWTIVTFLAVAGGVMLLLELALITTAIVAAHRGKRSDTATSVRTFLLAATCIYLAPCILFGFYDRYMLPALFPLIALIMFERPTVAAARASAQPALIRRTRFAAGASWLMLVLIASYTVAGTHDYLSWNRARWLLIDTLLDKGVPVTRIDGGYEFNGLYLYDPRFDFLKPQPKSWWVHDDQYVIQFTPKAGYRVIDNADAGGWLPPLRTRLLTLQRVAP